ncbi:MAG: class I SAM-dependent methyltransferase [Kofleriaceae bacterium]|nr:class I SAM-dependent methyltransferase [Kofleriaceae bacterium]
MSVSPDNQAQATLWSEAAGQAWVDFQDQMDRQLAVVSAAAVAALQPQRDEAILDVGCGCGATTLELAAAVGATGRVVGLDISVPMTALASRRIAEGNVQHASALVGDAQVMNGANVGGPFDAVFSRFGVMFFADPVAAFRNLGALTKRGGRLAFVCWQEARLNRIFGDLGRELAAIFPNQTPPDPHAPGPMAFADAQRLRAILTDAGWLNIEITSHVAPMQLFGTTDFDLALQASLRIGSAARALQTADELTAHRIHDAARRVLEAQWTDNGAIVDSATWIVTARNTTA